MHQDHHAASATIVHTRIILCSFQKVSTRAASNNSKQAAGPEEQGAGELSVCYARFCAI